MVISMTRQKIFLWKGYRILDIRNRFRFDIKDPRHNIFLMKAKLRKSYYMGVWHTHPQVMPEPSSIDWNDWYKTLDIDQTACEYAFFIIAGTTYIRATETYGYFDGATFANQIGLTTQMPATLEIVTSKESTKGRTVTVGSQAVRLKRPATAITSENAGLLQFLDAVSQAEKYSELSDSDTGILLKNYAKQQNYSKELLSSVLSGITGSAAKKLIEWGIIYEFTS